MKRRLFYLLTVLCLVVLSPLHAATITVFAAASLTDALKEIGAAYEKQTGHQVRFNFAASSMLARQIEEGAPADIFFSADESKMDVLKDLIVKETRKSKLSNLLVIVVASDSRLRISNPRDLAGPSVKRLALADPKSVPAGIYARTYLEKIGLWAALAPRVVPTDNVRAALAAVESGNVEAGIVYKTDASISKKVKVACGIPRNEGPDISYPVALVKASKLAEPAKKFLRYLDGAEATQVFEKFGFLIRE